MRTTLREARERVGISMADLADRLGVSVPSVSTLELNDERGAAKAETVERALGALGLARWDVVLPAERLRAILAEADSIVAEVDWTMGLEAQNLQPTALESIREKTISSLVAAAVGGA